MRNESAGREPKKFADWMQKEKLPVQSPSCWDLPFKVSETFSPASQMKANQMPPALPCSKRFKQLIRPTTSGRLVNC